MIPTGVGDYYDFLNLGYKLTASAGSDLPWGNTIGEVRVYAHTGAGFSADAWFNAMKKGHTFVTNGPMLLLTVDGRIPGDELAVLKNSTVRVRARAWAPEEIGSPKLLEVVAGGKIARAAESGEPSKGELNLEFDLRVEGGQWIAARVRTHNGGLAHTSPGTCWWTVASAVRPRRRIWLRSGSRCWTLLKPASGTSGSRRKRPTGRVKSRHSGNESARRGRGIGN